MSNKFRKNVLFIGIASFFGGISQDMFVPILPLYLANVLGMPKELIGLTEGIVTAGASVFKIIAGRLADRWRKNKPLIMAGYIFSLVARPLLIITHSFGGIFFARLLDGIGKGIKDSPKSALLANSTDTHTRGAYFGVHRTLDTLGSVVGPLILFVALSHWHTTVRAYQNIFLLTVVPLVVTIFILAIFVKDPPVESKKIDSAKNLPRTFYIFLGIMALFTLGNSSDAFLLLRAQSLGVSLLTIPLVYALFNFVYAAASIPLGALSDKIGREKVIVIGLGAYALAYLGFARATSAWHAWTLFAFYGVYYATTQGVANALIADIVPPDRRGSAYGFYNMTIGLLALPASFLAGFLWDHVGVSAPFYVGAAIAGVAAILLIFFRPTHSAPSL